MNYEDFLVPPKPISVEKWQLGASLKDSLVESGVALVFVSDYRGAGREAFSLDFSALRKELYSLAELEFPIAISDMGDLISGRSSEDTQYILQEFLSACHYNNTLPFIIGGSADLSFALYSALDFHQKEVSYTQVSSQVSLRGNESALNETNFLSRIFSSKQFSIENYAHLGYQKHLNSKESIDLIRQVEFDSVRLSELMNTPEVVEPYTRFSDLVTLNADAVESSAGAFSIHPQVNGLNRREICGVMKEIGMSEKLKSMGLFNLELQDQSQMNFQLMAQMIWYFLEGVSIRKSHPHEKQYETYWVMAEEGEYAFHREVFTNLWYFGNEKEIQSNLPCLRSDYENAKRGEWSTRLERHRKKQSSEG